MSAALRIACAILLCALPLVAAKRLAVVVGIDEYTNASGEFKPLHGSANDAQAIFSLLTSRFAFARSDIRLLRNKEATHEAIIGALNTLARNVSQGDEAVFFYAGHGSRAPRSDDRRFLDETIVPVDSRGPDPKNPAKQIYDIRASELQKIFDRIKAKTDHVTVILDSCHSGTAVRGEARNSRSAPPDTRWPQPPAAADKPDPANTLMTGVLRRGLVLVAAARDDQEANEYVDESVDMTSPDHKLVSVTRGAFTYFLIRELQQVKPTDTWQIVMRRVRAWVEGNDPSQSPQLETDHPETIVFGGRGLLVQPSYQVGSARNDLKQHVFTIDGGALQGVASGSVFEVYPHDAATFEKGKGIEVKLGDVFANESWLVLPAGVKLADGSQAVERRREYPDFKLTVDWGDSLASPAAAQAKAVLDMDDNHAYLSGAGGQLNIRVTDGLISATRPGGSAYGDPIHATDSDAADHLVARIRDFALWMHQLAIDNPASKSLLTVSIEPQRDFFLKGDCLNLTVRHDFPGEMYLAALDFNVTTGAIASFNLSPTGIDGVAGSNRSILPGTPVVIKLWAEDSGKDILKVFATDAPVNFEAARKGATRGGDALADLLTGGLGTRGAGSSVDRWATQIVAQEVRDTKDHHPTHEQSACLK